MQERIRQEGWSFTVGESDATRVPLENLCGAVEPPDWREKARWDPCLPNGRDLPATFDWRLVDPHGAVTAIRNQGNCGSCWAFGAMGAMESAILRATGQFVDLSEQWFVSCSASGSCNGGWHHKALEAATCNGTQYGDPCGGYGAVLESHFPYVASNSPCACPYNHPYCLEGWYAVGELNSIPTVEQIKQAIVDHGPVAVCVYVNDWFQAYRSGIFHICEDQWINHVVVLVGWDDNQGVWFMRNSWGASWGENGYMRIAYDCSRIGYATCYVVYPTPPPDCNGNGVPDETDIASGMSADCNANGIPDECDLVPSRPLVTQVQQLDCVLAQSFDDAGYPPFNTKQWDDFTTTEAVLLGTGQAWFQPANWGGYGQVSFLVEIADAPGGAEAGGNVLRSTTGSGANGIVTWDFHGSPLPAGTYWLSVQASGGFGSYGLVNWVRAAKKVPHGSQHYFHNPGGGYGHGTDPTPGSSWYGTPADMSFVLNMVKNVDCNSNGILDECDIAGGTSLDINSNGIPDECEAPSGSCRGDCNCDGSIGYGDIDYFVAAIGDDHERWAAMFAPGAPSCEFANCDLNGDGSIDWRDIDPLVFVLLTGAPCPPSTGNAATPAVPDVASLRRAAPKAANSTVK